MSSTRDKEVEEDMIQLTNELVEYFEDNITNIFSRKKDIYIAYSLIVLIRRRDEIENFNKKSLYILVREMTNVETTQITKVANVLRKQYKKILAEYDATGTIASNRENIFF